MENNSINHFLPREAGGIHWQKGQKGPLHRRQAVAPPPEASKSQKGGRGTSEVHRIYYEGKCLLATSY